MSNRNRVLTWAMVFIPVVLCPASMACIINDPPVPGFQWSPVFCPLAGQPASACGGNSYDPDNGPPYGFDNGITWHDWWPWATSGSASIVGYQGATHGCVDVTFSSTGKHYLYQQVTDDDYPAATSDWEQCDVWIFDMQLSIANSLLGVGDTSQLSLGYSPGNLYAGYKKLSVNSGGVVDILQGSTAVISGTDKEESWLLRSSSDPSTLTVKGVFPGQVTISLQYSPDGSSIPGGSYNGDSITAKVVRVYEVVKAGTLLNGPLYLPLNSTVQLKAKPLPSEGPWPSGKPTWEFVSQPGATGVITPSSGSDTVTVSGLSVAGRYDIKAKCGASDDGATIAVYAVKVDKLQYYSYITAEWVDVAGTVYVRKGDLISFRAVPNPSGTWPDGKPVWGGSSGASGTGEEKNVTFNTLSSSPSDYKTVTAECGNTVTANVIVFDFEGTLVPVDNFSNRNLDNYGLEEQVYLGCTIAPSGLTGSTLGGLRWKIPPIGVGSLSNVTTNGTALYDAEEAAGTANLWLEVLSGPSWGAFIPYSKTVVAPSDEYMIQKPGTGTRHLVNTCSAGLLAYVYLEPKDVSFSNLNWHEGTCTSTGTGFWAPSNGLVHPVGSTFSVFGGSATTGCQINCTDEVYSEGPPPYSVGQFNWPIPHEYKASDGVFHLVAVANHNAVADSAGKCTIEKKGAGPVWANAADPTSSW